MPLEAERTRRRVAPVKRRAGKHRTIDDLEDGMDLYLLSTVLTSGFVYLLWVHVVDHFPSEYHYAVALYLCWALAWVPSLPFHAFASVKRNRVGPRKNPFDFKARPMKYQMVAIHVATKLLLWGLAHHPYAQFFVLCLVTVGREAVRLLEYVPIEEKFENAIPKPVRLEWILTNSAAVIGPFVVGIFCLEVARDVWTVAVAAVVKAICHVLMNHMLTTPYLGTLTDYTSVNIYAAATMTMPLYVAIFAYVPGAHTVYCLMLAGLVDLLAFMSHKQMDIWPHDLYAKVAALPFAYMVLPGTFIWTSDRVALRYLWVFAITMISVYASPSIYRYRDVSLRAYQLDFLRGTRKGTRVDTQHPEKTTQLVASCQKSSWVLNLLSTCFGILAWAAYDQRVR